LVENGAVGESSHATNKPLECARRNFLSYLGKVSGSTGSTQEIGALQNNGVDESSMRGV
jgi:hypothetical protein